MKTWRTWKKMAAAILAICAAIALAATVTACSSDEPAADPVEVKVASLKGPTSIGMVDFMRASDAGETVNTYHFNICGTADEVLPELIQGNIDIALIPANAASVVYSKTEGAVEVIDINTLGVLYVVTGDESINEIAELEGRTVLMTGKGITPEYVMSYLLDMAGIADKVTLEYKSEATEVAAVLNADPNAIGVLPQPYATAVGLKNDALSSRISLTEAWDAIDEGGPNGQLVTGVTVIRKEFAEANPAVVTEFLEQHAASVDAVLADPEAAGQLVVDYGIMDNAAAAAKAIPACNLVCITAAEMKDALIGYLSILWDYDPASVGGALPGDDFYCMG